MKRAGQAEEGLIGADSCTRTDAVEQPTQGCKLSCFASLTLPQHPAAGRAWGEQGTALGGGPGTGRMGVQEGHAEAHGHPPRGRLDAGALKRQRGTSGLVYSPRRVISLPQLLLSPSSTHDILSTDAWRVNKAPLRDGCWGRGESPPLTLRAGVFADLTPVAAWHGGRAGARCRAEPGTSWS